LTRALIAARDARPWKTFEFVAAEPMEQLVEGYLTHHQPLAALKLAERVPALRPNPAAGNEHPAGAEATVGELSTGNNVQYQTLSDRTAARAQVGHADLLEQLSVAAEQLGDLQRARAFEQARLPLLTKTSDRRTAQTRLEYLREQQTAVKPEKVSLVVDQRSVTPGS